MVATMRFGFKQTVEGVVCSGVGVDIPSGGPAPRDQLSRLDVNLDGDAALVAYLSAELIKLLDVVVVVGGKVARRIDGDSA